MSCCCDLDFFKLAATVNTKEGVLFINPNKTKKTKDMVSGLYLGGEETVGVHYSCGLTWIAGTDRIYGGVDYDGDYMVIFERNTSEWFGNYDLTGYNIAIVKVLQISLYEVFVVCIA